jgi:hypothetical protein
MKDDMDGDYDDLSLNTNILLRTTTLFENGKCPNYPQNGNIAPKTTHLIIWPYYFYERPHNY